MTTLDARADDRSADEIVASAAAQFAQHLGYPPPPAGLRSAHPPKTALLRLHAEALLAVLDGQPHHDAGDPVIIELLGHEQRYWRTCARRAGVPLPAYPPDGDQLLRTVAGVATLLGADNPDEVSGLVRRALVTDTADPAWERWLRALYPHDGGAPERLGTVQPDLLGETLAVRMLLACDERHRARILTGLSPTQAAQALTILGRATALQPGVADLITPALRADIPVMAVAVFEVARQFPGLYAPRLAAVILESGLALADLEAAYRRIPRPSPELNPVGLAITTTALKRVSPDTPTAEHAKWQGSHASELARAGRWVDAVSASQKAVLLCEELDLDTHLADLALSLHNHAVLLAETSRRTEALAIGERAVALYRRLVAAQGHAHVPQLAASLDSHAMKLAHAGRGAEALAANQEALTLYQDLAPTDPAEFTPVLAISYDIRAALLGRAYRTTDALDASERALALRRELAAADREAYLPTLAALLDNHAIRLAVAGRRGEAVAARAEARVLYQEPAVPERGRYRPLLTRSWADLA